MDRYDLRAAEDPSRSERLELVKKSLERQRWDEAAKILQSLFDDEHDSLVYQEDRVWRTVSQQAFSLLRESPPEAMTAYLANSEAVATRDLKLALASQDFNSLVRVARRFPLTPAGQQACRPLIDAAIDLENTDAVAALVQQLVSLDSSQLADADWRGSIVSALKRAGHLDLVTQIEARFGQSVKNSDTPWQSGPPTPRIASWNWGSVSGSRDGRSLGSLTESIPLSRWRVPLLSSLTFNQVLESSLRDTLDTAALGVNVLSTVGEGSVIVTRSLSGLRAIHASTGEMIWTAREWGPDGEFDEGETEFQPLLPVAIERRMSQDLGYRMSHRMLFCASLGALSADSKHVYALAHFANERDRFELLIQPTFAEHDEDEPPESTYLYARDLQTGRVVWRAGGPASDDFPGLPCEGTFLFGPPTPDGDELFVVGERNGDVLLFCLDAETGLVRWEQLLASAGRTIELDTVRKCWTAPVAVRGSLIVCPTTTGWVTAVDRITRRIAWSTRLQARVPNDPFSESSFDAPNRESSIDERWAPAQPMFAGERVLVTTMEFPDENSQYSPQLTCLNALTGTIQWQLPKQEMLGLISSWQNSVLAFDQRTVRALNLADGSPIWSTPLSERLTGRPVLTDRGIVVPLMSGQFQVIDPGNGQVVDESLSRSVRHVQLSGDPTAKARTTIRPLGNLITAGGRLISTSPLEVVAFEWKSEVDRWKADARTNLPAAIQFARSLTLEGHSLEAVQLLRDSIALAGEDPEMQEQLRTARFEALISALAQRSLVDKAVTPVTEEWMKELHSLAQTSSEQIAVSRLEIELATRAGDWSAAWARLQELIREPSGPRVTFDDREIQSDLWIADQILEMGRLEDLTSRAAARSAILDELNRLSAMGDEAQLFRLSRLFAETGRGEQAALNALQRSPGPGNLARWQSLADSRDPKLAVPAALRIIEALSVPDWVGEARLRLASLPPRDQWPEELRPSFGVVEQTLSGIVDVHAQPGPAWLGHPIEIQRLSDYSSNDSTNEARLLLHWIGEPSGVSQFDYFYDEPMKSVRVLRRDGTQYWEMKLATNNDNPVDEAAPVIHASGLNLYVLHMGILHAFSPVERRALWRHHTALDEVDFLGGIWQSVKRRSRLSPVQEWRQELLRSSEDESRKLEVATPDVVVLRVERSIEVLDALDGTVLWSIPNCPIAPLRADHDRLYSLHPNSPWCRSIRSGRLITAPDLHRPEAPLVVTDSPAMLNIVEQPGDGRHWQVEAVRFAGGSIPGAGGTDPWDHSDVASIETAWQVAVPTDSHLGRGPTGSLVSLLPSGELRLIDWKTGKLSVLGTAKLPEAAASPESSPRFYSGADHERLYLTCDLGEDPGELDAPSIPAFGRVSAFPLHDLALPIWQLETQGFLLTRGTRNTTFLPIVRLQAHRLADRNYSRVNLQLIDKASGQTVYELQNSPVWGQGISTCDFDVRQQRWYLTLVAERIRLSPVKK
jgi:outer membrane protein assembly factor BamB